MLKLVGCGDLKKNLICSHREKYQEKKILMNWTCTRHGGFL